MSIIKILENPQKYIHKLHLFQYGYWHCVRVNKIQNSNQYNYILWNQIVKGRNQDRKEHQNNIRQLKLLYKNIIKVPFQIRKKYFRTNCAYKEFHLYIELKSKLE